MCDSLKEKELAKINKELKDKEPLRKQLENDKVLSEKAESLCAKMEQLNTARMES